MPGLLARSPVGVCERQPDDVSLTHHPSFSLSAPLSNDKEIKSFINKHGNYICKYILVHHNLYKYGNNYYYVLIYKEIYFKELAPAAVGASKSEIWRAGQQARLSAQS